MSVDDNNNTSGDGGSHSNEQGSDNDSQASGDSKDFVKYDSYRKLLGEKKKRDEQLRSALEKLESFEAAQKEREETELKEQNKWKDLVSLRDEENSKLKNQLATFQQRQIESLKLDAFLSTIESKVDRKYWGLVDLESIKVNPETHEVDDMSVSQVVETFRKEYPEVLLQKPAGKLPNDAAKSDGVMNTDTSKLPPKERRKALATDLAASGFFSK